jgi:hypothetical protein
MLTSFRLAFRPAEHNRNLVVYRKSGALLSQMWKKRRIPFQKASFALLVAI